MADSPKRVPAMVVAANHASHLDAPLILCSLPRDLRRIAVGAAADYFFTSRMRSLGLRLFFTAFPVHRRRGGLDEAHRRLAAGWNVLLFPEGTRSSDGSIGEFRPGVGVLCVGHGVPCLPVGIIGTYEAMPRGRHWPRRHRPSVTVQIGTPLVAGTNEDATAFTARLDAAVRALIHRPEGENAHDVA